MIPIRWILPVALCARAASGHAAAPANNVTNSRRLIAFSKAQDWTLKVSHRKVTDMVARSRCPLWVKSIHRDTFNRCPLYPQKRTSELTRGMSALCQKQTYAVQQFDPDSLGKVY